MRQPVTGRDWWTHLENIPGASHAIARAEQAARDTLPSLFYEDGTEYPDQEQVAPEWQSYGAQLVNHLATRLMMSLFAPSRPFVRLDPAKPLKQAAEAAEVDESVLREALAEGERAMVRLLDQKSMRPKLFELIKQLIVVGPTVAVFDRDTEQVRVISLRYHRLKRDIYGRMHTLVIKEEVFRDELPEDLQAAVPYGTENTNKVCYYVLVQAIPKSKKYKVSHYVEDVEVPEWGKTYSEDKLPYRALTWTLGDASDYGNSLVSEYAGDFAAMRQLSAAMAQAGILASEYRWLKDPAATMDGKEFEDSANGEVVSGEGGALKIVNVASEMANAMQAQQLVLNPIYQRLARAFVMTSAVVRDSERTTATEFAALAHELDTALGGGYSRLAVDVQRPMAFFLMDILDVAFAPKDIDLSIVTGLDALSRHGDLTNLREWLADMGALHQAPPEVLQTLDVRALALDLASPRGISASKYLLSEEQVQANLDANAQREAVAKGAQPEETPPA